MVSEPSCINTHPKALFVTFNVYVQSYYLCVTQKRAVAIASDNNLHLLQHYQRYNAALFGMSLLCVTRPSCRLYRSCLSVRFYDLFILLIFFYLLCDYFFQDNGWFTMKGWWKDWLLPAAIYSFMC